MLSGTVVDYHKKTVSTKTAFAGNLLKFLKNSNINMFKKSAILRIISLNRPPVQT